KILAQRLDPASCASLPFKNDRLEAQFAKLVGAGKTRQSSAHNDHFSLRFGRANKHCRSEGRCCCRCRCQEIPSVHHFFILISCFSGNEAASAARSFESASLLAPADECVANRW